jgi:CRP-like cAMP-binding protein
MHSIVAQALSLFRFLKHIDKATLFELAKTVHYYPVAMQNSNLFSQFESPDSICLVLSGKIQYYMETPSHEIKTCPIAELGAGESIGVIDLLFTANDGALVNIPRIQGELEGESRAFSSDLTESLDESTTKANISTRSFHPHMFVSYNVAEVIFLVTTYAQLI